MDIRGRRYYMSLIKCVECGNLISDKSEICIHCGCPTSESVPNNQDTICYINDKAIDFSDCISEILNFINQLIHLILYFFFILTN